MKKLLLALIILSAAVPFVTAESSNSLSGREIAELGKSVEISGILSEEDSEWYIDSGSTRYAVHLGNEEYRESIDLNLRAGENAEIKGYISGTDIAVCTITSDGKEYTLRDESGRPAWAGSGRRRNING